MTGTVAAIVARLPFCFVPDITPKTRHLGTKYGIEARYPGVVILDQFVCRTVGLVFLALLVFDFGGIIIFGFDLFLADQFRDYAAHHHVTGGGTRVGRA